MAQRLNLTLDDHYAEKLDRVASRAHLASGTLARSLLCEAIDQAEAATDENSIAKAGATAMTAILAAAPGFSQRFERGVADARASRTVSLDEL